MHNTQPRELVLYRTTNGKEPFTEWFESIKDRTILNRIERRIDRLRDGNFGDCKSVGGGVFELRLHFGPGYRIYYGEVSNSVLILLCAGDKSSQQRNIEQAKVYWLDYKGVER